MPTVPEAERHRERHSCVVRSHVHQSVDSQLELPFSVDRLIAFCILIGRLSFNSVATCDCWCVLAFAVTCLIQSCSTFVVLGYWWDCSTMRAVSGAVILFDASWCATSLADGLGIPRPPNCTGNAMSSQVLSLKAF